MDTQRPDDVAAHKSPARPRVTHTITIWITFTRTIVTNLPHSGLRNRHSQRPRLSVNVGDIDDKLRVYFNTTILHLHEASSRSAAMLFVCSGDECHHTQPPRQL